MTKALNPRRIFQQELAILTGNESPNLCDEYQQFVDQLIDDGLISVPCPFPGELLALSYASTISSRFRQFLTQHTSEEYKTLRKEVLDDDMIKSTLIVIEAAFWSSHWRK